MANAAVTSSAGDNNGFQTNPANVYTDGSGVAQDVNSGTNNNSSCTANSKDKHRFYNYNISLPGGVTVTGNECLLDVLEILPAQHDLARLATLETRWKRIRQMRILRAGLSRCRSGDQGHEREGEQQGRELQEGVPVHRSLAKETCGSP